MTEYVPPFLKAYCERYEGTVWNGCWAESCARLIDMLSEGAVAGLTEADIRAAAWVPDHNLASDGGTVDDQVYAIRHWLPSANLTLRPTPAQLSAGLAAGGAALLSGYEHNAPLFDRPLDPAFYDNTKSAHSVYVQGVSPLVVLWGNPEEFLGAPYDYVSIADVLKFVWPASGGRLEAVLGQLPPPPPQTPGRTAVKYTTIPGDPIRVLDTRFGNGLTGKFMSHVPRAVQVAGRTYVRDDKSIVTIPATAIAVNANLTVTNQTAPGFLAAGPDPNANPAWSNLNFPLHDGDGHTDNRPNALAGVALNANGTLAIIAVHWPSGNCDAILDVNGYFETDDAPVV